MRNGGTVSWAESPTVRPEEAIAAGLGISVVLTFRGDAAVRAKDGKLGEEQYWRLAGGTNPEAICKIRLVPERVKGVGLSFSLVEVGLRMIELDIAEQCAQIQFVRDVRFCRAACARHGEGVLWGFGRPHPTKPTFKPHQSYAGPLIDHRPGTRADWTGFRPVYVGWKSETGEGRWRGLLRAETSWTEGDITVLVTHDPEDAPEELREFLRSWRASKLCVQKDKV